MNKLFITSWTSVNLLILQSMSVCLFACLSVCLIILLLSARFQKCKDGQTENEGKRERARENRKSYECVFSFWLININLNTSAYSSTHGVNKGEVAGSQAGRHTTPEEGHTSVYALNLVETLSALQLLLPLPSKVYLSKDF